MSFENLDEIAEVAECGRQYANRYLDAGYRILSIFKLQKTGQDGRYEIVTYVMGRAALTLHFDPELAPVQRQEAVI